MGRTKAENDGGTGMGRESGRSNAKGKESQIIRAKKKAAEAAERVKKIAGTEPGQ